MGEAISKPKVVENVTLCPMSLIVFTSHLNSSSSWSLVGYSHVNSRNLVKKAKISMLMTYTIYNIYLS